MRATLIVLMILGVVATAGIGVLAASNGFGEDADKAAQLVTQMETLLGAESEKVAELKTMVSGYKTSSIGALLLILLTVGVSVLTFAKKAKPQTIAVAATIAVAVLFIALSPSIDMGPTGKADPRTQALMVGIPGALAALFAFGAEKVRQKKALAV